MNVTVFIDLYFFAWIEFETKEFSVKALTFKDPEWDVKTTFLKGKTLITWSKQKVLT